MAEREDERMVIESQAPGKLYIAGEYAVVEHGHPAILVAVNRMLAVRVSARECTAQAAGGIRSDGHDEAEVTWHRNGQGLCTPDQERPGAAYLIAAIRCVEELVRAAGGTLRAFDMHVASDLDDASGRKYGIGSSAAVTVAGMRALLRFYRLELAPMAQYKLAFAIARRAGNVGSGGDLAASLFGGCIRFCSPDRAWVGMRLDDTPLPELIRMPWPDLNVSRLHVFGSGPESKQHNGGGHELVEESARFAALRLLVGWTGSPASTADLVTHVQHHSTDERERRYREFLEHSDRCVDELCEALAQADMPAVRRRIAHARELLLGLSSLTGTLIETPKLTALVEAALGHGAASKSSGAGGGDCGIAIIGVDSDADDGASGGKTDAGAAQSAASAIFRDWRSAGIEPLDLAVCKPLAEAAQWRTKRSSRKDDHVRLALRQHEQEPNNAFDDVRFIHHALCGVSLDQIDTSTTVCGSHWQLPFYINAMTGGSQRSGGINAALARAAQATGIAIASGSQHAALRDPALAATFTAIRAQSQGFVFANVGPTVTPQQAVRAVAMLGANALQIHVNIAQEIVMPEGNRDFSDWPQRIREIIAASPVPVVVKEVGFGMSRRSVEQLAALGARTVDVSGRGGTDFAAIENSRRAAHEYGYLDGWGQSTVLCLLDCLGGAPIGSDILASGGVRNPLDVIKALALGAEAVGVSGHFLRVLQDRGESGLVDEINAWAEQLRSLMGLLGAKTVDELQRTDLLLGGMTLEQAKLLGVDVALLSHRSVRAGV